MPIYEGTTVEEAINQGLRSLNLTNEDVQIEIITESKKGFLGFGKKKAQVLIEPTVSEQISEAVEETIEDIIVSDAEETIEVAAEKRIAKDIAEPILTELSVLEDLEDEDAIAQLSLYLSTISKELNTPALVRLEKKEGSFIFHLDTEKQGMLIGKHGKILNALQYLAQVFVHRIARNKLSVVVNVGDYREKRQAILERLAQRTAEKVRKTGRPVFLEPMPAFERKQIHYTLSKEDGIRTHSEGDEPYRYLVIELAKPHD